MLQIEVLAPTKTEDRYEVRYVTWRKRSWRSRILRPRRTRTAQGTSEGSFGFRALNFEIDHHDVWDGVYPLYFLTRRGGPLFEKGPDRAHIRFEYPIPAVVKDFYIGRAAHFGITITVEATITDARLDLPTNGNVLAFGGGKDSRMLLGIMREAGLDPIVITSGAENVRDIPEALVTEPVNGLPGALADRLMPAYMALGRHLYLGAGIGEAHYETPWQQYYDIGAERALKEVSRLFRDLNVETGLHAPASVLPYNIIQRILHDRYPELYAGQVSVPVESAKEKNLHVSLLKYAHGISFSDHCSEPLFRQLLEKFVRRQTRKPDRFGYRNHREVIDREMRAIIWRKRDDELFSSVREIVPSDWDGPWIDYIHTYVSPSLDPTFLSVFRQYAPMIDEAPRGTAVRRIAV